MRLIDADELKKAIDDYAEKNTLHWLSDIEDLIDNAQTVTLPMCKAKDEAICEEMTTDGHCNCSKPCPNKEIERSQGDCEECDFRKFTETFIDGVVDLMSKNDITSIEQLSEILKGGRQ